MVGRKEQQGEREGERNAGSVVLPQQAGPMESRADMLNEGGKISEAPSLTSLSAPPLAGCSGVASWLTNVRGIRLQQRVDFTKETCENQHMKVKKCQCTRFPCRKKKGKKKRSTRGGIKKKVKGDFLGFTLMADLVLIAVKQSLLTVASYS